MPFQYLILDGFVVKYYIFVAGIVGSLVVGRYDRGKKTNASTKNSATGLDLFTNNWILHLKMLKHCNRWSHVYQDRSHCILPPRCAPKQVSNTQTEAQKPATVATSSISSIGVMVRTPGLKQLPQKPPPPSTQKWKLRFETDAKAKKRN